jgi:hypothetical protein
MALLTRGLTIDGCHDEADLGGISSASKMGVDLLCLMLVQGDESVEDVIASQSIVLTSLIVGEVVLHRADGQLLLESINLVEPSRIADGVKQGECFLHTVDCLIFKQELIVLGDGDEEENGGNVLEAVDPLLSLRSLSSHIEHAVGEISNDEGGLGNTSGLDTGSENILVVGHVIGLSDTVDVVKVAMSR